MPKRKKQAKPVCKTCKCELGAIRGLIKGRQYCMKHYRLLAKPVKLSKNRKDLDCHIIDGQVVYY